MAKFKKIKICCDASCLIPNANIKGRPNFGKAAGAYVFFNEYEELIEQGSFPLGETSPYIAEYKTLAYVLDKAAAICRGKIEVWMDAEYVVRHMNGTYGLKSETVKPIFDLIKSLEKRFEKATYFHHSRETELGKLVDNLAKKEASKY